MRGFVHSFAAAGRAVLAMAPFLAAGTLFAVDRYVSPLPDAWRPGLGAAGLVASIAGLAALGALAWHRDRHLRYRDGYRAESARREETEARIRELRGRVDVLTAEREIGLILNSPDASLERVLALTADALSAREGDRIEIHRADGAGPPARVAAWENGRAVRPKWPEAAGSDPLVEPALARGGMVLAAEAGRLRVGIPLTCDLETIGALKLDLRGEGSDRVRFVQDNLPELARFVSLAVKTQDLYRRATEDGLTGLSTRRHFGSQLDLLFGLSRRHGDPLSLLMIDVDHFKRINDTHGHQAGDEVLKGVAEVLKKHSRRSGDTKGGAHRYGGEEMSILLPRTPAGGAKAVAEKIRREIEAKTFRFGGKPMKVTVSVGVAQFVPTMPAPEALVRAADEALYSAKTTGRNRVVVAESQIR
jgi:diguanylate cyclase (GGDEF)-like protein